MNPPSAYIKSVVPYRLATPAYKYIRISVQVQILFINNLNIMFLAISQPALIAHMLSFERFIASCCYSAETNSRATMSIYFFVNINFHGDSFLPTELPAQIKTTGFIVR